jgi:hypothetical protein
MASISSSSVRVAPQQERSARRFAGFLDAAAQLFVELDFEAATMTAIAEHQYSQDLEAHWKPLMEQAKTLTHAEFADLFIERITQFVRERPAFLRLLAAPIRFRRDPAARKASRVLIANAFRAKNPSLPPEQSILIANVTLQIIRGMMTVYAEAEPKGKALVVAEFKKVLTLYLGSVLSENSARAK